jgi:eukaryotic-like serine/threonine-protein kinase
MSSIIEGYNYDIFISYRQKDNKYDGWVTEFVDHLKAELESTFKEEVSVYFDINPHDGLLETHDVDASLKDKLKCLIFIPIISRTYCDPKSFAWEHEFKAFVELASGDQFGLKIKLPNGNVANRLLPVRINDLDISDFKLCESILGGVFRGIDFIYKEPGVNRPLRSNEDNPHDNLNHTIYRNQINKVALAVKDIMESMKVSVSPDQLKHKDIQEKEIKIKEPVEKDSIESKKESRAKKIKPEKTGRFPHLKKSRIWISGISLMVLLGVGIAMLSRQARIKWAKEEALTEIEQLINKGNIIDAYNLVQKAEKYIADDPKFKELSSLTSSECTITTDPPGADVFIREYSDVNGKWKKLGTTPIDSIQIPGGHSYWITSSVFLTRIKKPGYEEVLAVTSTLRSPLTRKLFKTGEIPPGMVYVDLWGFRFFIDRYEVTNKQFKEFVDQGGYSNPIYWKNEFRKDGKVIPRNEAMAFFVDNTGRPGPFTWEAADYPDGQDDYPVSGVSWYEAAAYAEYAGKSLPASDHWGSAEGGLYWTLSHKIIPLSNFKGKGPEPVGKNNGITFFGCYDMAGNVREWCWNESPAGHIIRGGAWNDATYLFSDLSQLPSFDRSPKNGFRCVRYINKENFSASVFQQVLYNEEKDYSAKKPVPEDIFKIYKNQFLYDSTDLKALTEEKINKYEDWTIEKISFNAAYGKERVIAYLFLPRNVSPPFHTLIYFPGKNTLSETDLIKSEDTKWQIDYLIKSGIAVMCPVYKGTFERIDPNDPPVDTGHKGTEWMIKWVKDFSRSVDYLETRPDIDHARLGFYGRSMGGVMGGIIPAIEKRLAVNIIIIGGFHGTLLPEADPVNYVSRITIPTLMLNGRYDYRFPLENNVKPFYKLLGTPEKDKKLVVYPTDHNVPKNEMIKEVLAWCDKYLGPVNYKNK